jgi:excisionase family DNA binding protein|tara:strand:+ start:1452 stop:1688 length:237 start_codon:yes stop_codon:yes gene_type:complete
MEQLATIEELAKHFRVSVSTVRAWLRNGHIPEHTYVSVGHTYRFKIPLVEAAMLSRTSTDDWKGNTLVDLGLSVDEDA